MNKEFIPYEQALDLKELGFNEPCFGYYSNGNLVYGNHTNNMMQRFRYSAPTFSQAFRWFRGKYNLFGCIDLHVSTPLHWFIRIDKIDINDYLYHSEDGNIQYSTYEEAELACLLKLIEIVKQ
jgi:hypothetical protein